MDTIDQNLRAIRSLMERSTRFTSISGISGVLAGAYALAGAWAAEVYFLPAGAKGAMVFTALLILSLALLTAGLLSYRNARRHGERINSRPVRLLLSSLGLPLLAGGVFTLLLLEQGYLGLLSGSMLAFYGLALINASKYAAAYIKKLGVLQTALGLMAVAWPAHSLLLWSLGFGWLHIGFGFYVYWKHEP